MSEFTQAIERNLEGLQHVSTGLVGCCKTCRAPFHLSDTQFVKGIEDGDIFDEGAFSWADCESCGSRLGGTRYSGHALTKDSRVVHLEVCEECLCYHANGDEPTNWEG